ncbi:hypothetical protein GOBAR_DD10151 [Gossypium barbadense]|nr:hypothetical protein GOBAR_DD10151 [Gossypium barbadense]
MKQSPNSTSTSAAQTLTSQESRLLVRETLRISASLASNAGLSSSTGIHEGAAIPLMDENRRMGLVGDEFRDSSLKLICCEEIDGRRWKYVAEKDSFGNFKNNSIRTVSLHTPQAPLDELMSFVRSYVVPEGFPESVTPSYVPYMTWRALKHFFGGAMGVFTTQTLLNSVGISRNSATPGAVAINWILKRKKALGAMLFEFNLKALPLFAGSRFRDAFQDPGAFLAIEPLFEKERYIVTYNPSKGKVYALLKDQAKSDDILKAAFHAHVLLHFIHSADNSLSSRSQHEHLMPAATDFELHIAESCKMVSTSYRHFKNNAAEQAVKELNPKWSEPDACLTPLKGWRMSDSLLNPGRARLH